LKQTGGLVEKISRLFRKKKSVEIGSISLVRPPLANLSTELSTEKERQLARTVVDRGKAVVELAQIWKEKMVAKAFAAVAQGALAGVVLRILNRNYLPLSSRDHSYGVAISSTLQIASSQAPRNDNVRRNPEGGLLRMKKTEHAIKHLEKKKRKKEKLLKN
jgi:hypothetical protein